MAFGEITKLIQENLLPTVNSILEARLGTFSSIMDRIGFPILMALIAVLFIFKNRKNAVERGEKPLIYILIGLVICAAAAALGWIFTVPFAAAIITFYGGTISSKISDNFKPGKHSALATALAVVNVLVGLFALIIWGVWLFDNSKTMSWFLLVIIGVIAFVFGNSTLGLLTASTGNAKKDKAVRIKNIGAFVISVAFVAWGIYYIVNNGMVLS